MELSNRGRWILIVLVAVLAAGPAWSIPTSAAEARATYAELQRKLQEARAERDQVNQEIADIKERRIAEAEREYNALSKEFSAWEKANPKPEKDIKNPWYKPNERSLDNQVALKEWEAQRAKAALARDKAHEKINNLIKRCANLANDVLPAKERAVADRTAALYLFVGAYTPFLVGGRVVDALEGVWTEGQGMANAASTSAPASPAPNPAGSRQARGADLGVLTGERQGSSSGSPSASARPPAAPVATASPAPTASPRSDAGGSTGGKRVVKPGDTLTAIAKELSPQLGNPPLYGQTGLVSALFRSIEGTTSGDPNLIFPGQVIDLAKVRKELAG